MTKINVELLHRMAEVADRKKKYLNDYGNYLQYQKLPTTFLLVSQELRDNEFVVGRISYPSVETKNDKKRMKEIFYEKYKNAFIWHIDDNSFRQETTPFRLATLSALRYYYASTTGNYFSNDAACPGTYNIAAWNYDFNKIIEDPNINISLQFKMDNNYLDDLKKFYDNLMSDTAYLTTSDLKDTIYIHCSELIEKYDETIVMQWAQEK